MAVETAAGNEEVAYSGFLPTLQGNYSFQAFSSDVGFTGQRGRFPVLPVRGFGPGTQDFHVAELQLRWVVYQFGRQVAKHDQATLRAEIARLQADRARQSVDFDVSQAYFRALEARSSLVIAEQAPLLHRPYLYAPRGPVVADPASPALGALVAAAQREARKRGAFMLKVEPSVEHGDQGWLAALARLVVAW